MVVKHSMAKWAALFSDLIATFALLLLRVPS